MELMDLYDKDRNPIGKTIVRDDPMPPDAFLLVVQVCIFNSKGQMLIQRRQTSKSIWPGLWDVSSSGAVDCGEDTRTAAMREVREELGLDIDLKKAVTDLSTRLEDAFCDTYIFHMDVDETTLTLQPEEVCDVRWATEEEVLELLRQARFVPYHPSFISYLFFRSKHIGNLTTDK